MFDICNWFLVIDLQHIGLCSVLVLVAVKPLTLYILLKDGRNRMHYTSSEGCYELHLPMLQIYGINSFLLILNIIRQPGKEVDVYFPSIANLNPISATMKCTKDWFSSPKSCPAPLTLSG